MNAAAVVVDILDSLFFSSRPPVNLFLHSLSVNIRFCVELQRMQLNFFLCFALLLGFSLSMFLSCLLSIFFLDSSCWLLLNTSLHFCVKIMDEIKLFCWRMFFCGRIRGRTKKRSVGTTKAYNGSAFSTRAQPRHCTRCDHHTIHTVTQISTQTTHTLHDIFLPDTVSLNHQAPRNTSQPYPTTRNWLPSLPKCWGHNHVLKIDPKSVIKLHRNVNL